MNIIVAANSDWGIGLGGTQQIVLPEDRRHFREITGNGAVIAGRKTLEDFPGGKPLPNRKNIVFTRRGDFRVDGAIVVHSVAELFPEISNDDPDKVFVIGGGSIYNLLLPFCVFAYVTRIDAAPPADTFFPDLDAMPNWLLESKSEPQKSGEVSYSFELYKNIAPKSIEEAIHV